MRIAVIYPEPLPSEKARAVTVVNTSCALARRGLETTLYAEAGGSGLPEISRAYDCDPAALRLSPLSKKGFGVLRSNRFFNRRLERALQREPAQILYVRHLKAARHLIEHRRPGQHIVFECHEIFHQTTTRADKRAQIRALEAYVYRHADGLVFINRTLREETRTVFDHLAIHQCVAYPGTTPPQEVNRHKSFESIEEIYYIGSLYPWKGVETLIRAMPAIPGVTLRLIGAADAARRAEIEALIARHRLAGRIRLEGHRPNREIRSMLANQALLTVIPNDAGPFARFTSPLKLFEYMSSHCVTVAADIETIREIGGEPAPFLLYPAGDAKALAERVNNLRNNPAEARRLADAALQRSRAFTWDARAERLAEFFQQLRQPA